MPRPTTPQFEEDYLAFIARCAPGHDAALARLEFVERLGDLLDLAAPEPGPRDPAPAVAPPHLDLSGRLEIVRPTARRCASGTASGSPG